MESVSSSDSIYKTVSSYGDLESIKPLPTINRFNSIRPSLQHDSPWNLSMTLFFHDTKSDLPPSKPESNKTNQLVLSLENLFYFLHRPTGIAFLYHFLIICLIIINCVMINFIPVPQLFQNTSQINLNPEFVIINILDTILGVILTVELCLRFWSTEFELRYKKLYGKFVYFYDYIGRRLCDIFGIFTFFSFVIFNILNENFSKTETQYTLGSKMMNINIMFRFAHLFQIVQIHRVVKKLTDPLKVALNLQISQLLLAALGMLTVLIITSFVVHIIECNYTQSKIKFISQSSWLVYETFFTVGYGDMIPVADQSKLVLCIMSLIGVVAFLLPSYIIGNGLSIVIRDRRRLTFKYLSTATLISTEMVHHTPNIVRSSVSVIRNHTNLNFRTDKEKLTAHGSNYSTYNMRKESLSEQSDDGPKTKLWDKLLLIQNRVSKKNNKCKKNPSDDSYRVISYFQNIDLTKYSNNNSALWYNISLVEEDITDMSQLMHEDIVTKANQIQDIIEEISKIKR